MPRAPAPQKAVVNASSLVRTALQSQTPAARHRQPRDAAADEGALVHVRVNHVGPKRSAVTSDVQDNSASKANLWREEPTS